MPRILAGSHRSLEGLALAKLLHFGRWARFRVCVCADHGVHAPDLIRLRSSLQEIGLLVDLIRFWRPSAADLQGWGSWCGGTRGHMRCCTCRPMFTLPLELLSQSECRSWELHGKLKNFYRYYASSLACLDVNARVWNYFRSQVERFIAAFASRCESRWKPVRVFVTLFCERVAADRDSRSMFGLILTWCLQQGDLHYREQSNRCSNQGS